MKVGLVYHPIYLKHDTGQHIENARRLEATMAHLEKSGILEQLTSIQPRAASIEELALVHHRLMISQVQETAQRGGGWLDPDTVTSADSYEAALYAAGGMIKATEAVMNGEVNSAYALVRPPGHHATTRRAMGFCLFNNIAIAAKHALSEYKLERLLIIDFDVHHGNGTQEAFYHDPQVLYVSTHEYPFYPGTGNAAETGTGIAEGTTLNIPLPAGCGDAQYQQVFEQIVAPAAERFEPQLIMVSAGYDAHWADGLAMMQVSITGFAQITRIIQELARTLCQRRTVFTLEGGYDTDALACSIKATLDVLLGDSDIEDPLGQSPHRSAAPDIAPLVNKIREIHALC